MTKQQSWKSSETVHDVWEWTSSRPCVVIAHGHLICIERMRDGGLLIFSGMAHNLQDGQRVFDGPLTKLYGVSWRTGLSRYFLPSQPTSVKKPRVTGRRAASKGRGSLGGKK